MKHLIKHTLAVTGLGIVLAGPGLAHAGPAMIASGPPERMLEHMAEHLDLSDEQREQVRAIFDRGDELARADRERLHELRSRLRDNRDDFDAGAVQAAADEIGQITARMTYRMAEKQHQVREVLTGEQREELDEFAERRKEHRGKRLWRQGPPPGEE